MLTDERIELIWNTVKSGRMPSEVKALFARAIEAEVRKEQADKIAELERKVDIGRNIVRNDTHRAGQYQARIDELEKQLEEARKDSEIVNWLSVQDYDHLVISHCVDCTHDGQIYVSGDNDRDNYGDTLRDAVLYAIAKEQP